MLKKSGNINNITEIYQKADIFTKALKPVSIKETISLKNFSKIEGVY